MLVVYNTLTRKKEPFKPIHDGEVRMYVCGVTVYDSCHLGHARSIVAFDVIRRYLEYKGYNVRYIQNFTDIDDKMIQRAQEQGVAFDKLATKYIREYFEDIDPLGVKRATAYPKATEHIKDMITIIEKLVKKGYAYEANGSVYFRVSKFKNYGKLSRRSIKDIKEAAEKAEPGEKEKVEDFVLWKRMKPGEPYWKSPWGKGRPGWHIECSAMAMKYLGETLDISGGGEDNIFPHHENTIAQSEAVTGKPFVRYWIHVRHLSLNGERMSKSTGNFITVRDAVSKFGAANVRLLLLSTHYRKPMDFNATDLKRVKKKLERLQQTISLLKSAQQSQKTSYPEDQSLSQELAEMERQFQKALSNDFNTALAISHLHRYISIIQQHLQPTPHVGKQLAIKILATLQQIGTILFGDLYSQQVANTPEADISPLVSFLLKERERLRQNGQFDQADAIRTVLKNMGIEITDTATGPLWWQTPTV